MTAIESPAAPAAAASESAARGVALVAAAAVCWSFGGTIARTLETADSWAVIFWRSLFAAGFLLAFMAVRDGPRETARLFADMGAAGVAVGVCFATASTSFIVALQYTTVANILLMQAGAPLIAALLAWALFRETVSRATALAIAAVVAGVAIMVSDSVAGDVSMRGDGLALLIAIAFAVATVITRRSAAVRMTPAVFLAVLLSGSIGAAFAGSFAVSAADLGLLFVFGAFNLGLGMALFVSGARLLPAALAALICTLEPVLGPIWVWFSHGEIPTTRTLVGGGVVFAALLAHTVVELRRQSRAQKPGLSIPAGDAVKTS